MTTASTAAQRDTSLPLVLLVMSLQVYNDRKARYTLPESTSREHGCQKMTPVFTGRIGHRYGAGVSTAVFTGVQNSARVILEHGYSVNQWLKYKFGT